MMPNTIPYDKNGRWQPFLSSERLTLRPGKGGLREMIPVYFL
jgi:hypothetical protein